MTVDAINELDLSYTNTRITLGRNPNRRPKLGRLTPTPHPNNAHSAPDPSLPYRRPSGYAPTITDGTGDRLQAEHPNSVFLRRGRPAGTGAVSARNSYTPQERIGAASKRRTDHVTRRQGVRNGPLSWEFQECCSQHVVCSRLATY